jgi:hypothetical protein
VDKQSEVPAQSTGQWAEDLQRSGNIAGAPQQHASGQWHGGDTGASWQPNAAQFVGSDASMQWQHDAEEWPGTDTSVSRPHDAGQWVGGDAGMPKRSKKKGRSTQRQSSRVTISDRIEFQEPTGETNGAGIVPYQGPPNGSPPPAEFGSGEFDEDSPPEGFPPQEDPGTQASAPQADVQSKKPKRKGFKFGLCCGGGPKRNGKLADDDD